MDPVFIVLQQNAHDQTKTSGSVSADLTCSVLHACACAFVCVRARVCVRQSGNTTTVAHLTLAGATAGLADVAVLAVVDSNGVAGMLCTATTVALRRSVALRTLLQLRRRPLGDPSAAEGSVPRSGVQDGAPRSATGMPPDCCVLPALARCDMATRHVPAFVRQSIARGASAGEQRAVGGVQLGQVGSVSALHLLDRRPRGTRVLRPPHRHVPPVEPVGDPPRVREEERRPVAHHRALAAYTVCANSVQTVNGTV